MIRLRKTSFWIALAGLVLGMTLTSLSQPDRPPEFQAARKLIVDGYFSKGVQAYLKIAADHAGTDWGAIALSEAASYSQTIPEKDALYQRLIREYPESRYAMAARSHQLVYQYGRHNAEAWLPHLDQLAQSYGGPGLQEILQARSLSVLTRQVLALSEDRQVGLYGIYSTMDTGLSYELGRRRETLPLDVFLRQTFARFDSSGELLDNLKLHWIRANQFSANGVRDYFVDPKVRVKPHSRTTGPRPRWTFEFSTAPLPARQVELATSRITLDGVDFFPQLQVSSLVELQPSKKNRPFEILRLSGRPASPLARGNHNLTLEIRAEGYPGSGPGLTRVECPFRVASERDEEKEDGDDLDKDWDE